MLRHYLQWHIIHSCNLHCTHCYQDDYLAKLSLPDMQVVLDKYEAYLKLHHYEGQVNLTGGEPLLHPDFWAVAGEIVGRRIRLGILTNGTLIDSEIANRIGKLRPVFVQVSIDGTKDIHDKIRSEGSFDKAFEGIDELKKAGVKVLVSFTAMKFNFRSFESVAAECKKHNVDKLWWDRVVSDDVNVYLTSAEFKEMSQKAVKCKKKYPFVSNDRALQGLLNNECGYECSVGKRLLIVLANGDMMACRRLPFVIGNIFEEDNLDALLLKSDVLKKLRHIPIPQECIGCRFSAKCAGGAKCVTYAETGRLDCKDVNCYLK